MEKEMKAWLIIAVTHTTEIEALKISSLNGIRTHDF